MRKRSTLVLSLLTILMAVPASGAPSGVEISLRISSPVALGGFSEPQVDFTANLVSVQPDGSFTLSNVLPTQAVSMSTPSAFALSVSNGYLVFTGGAFRLNGGSFGPGTGGFGGSASIVTHDNLQYVHDVLLGRDVVVNTGWVGPIFGADGAVRAFAGVGTTVISGVAGRWTTATVTLAGVHDVLGAFSTQVAGMDQRNAAGVGLLSMVSPVFFE